MNNRIFIFFIVTLQAVCALAAPRSRFLMHMTAAPSHDYLKALRKCGTIVAQNWKSPVQTRIEVKFRNDMKTAYASAYPTHFNYVKGVLFNAAMEKRITGKDVNAKEKGDKYYDMVIQFNMKHDWYLGIDGKPGPGQMDFVSVCLHEAMHGLFMASSSIEISRHKDGYAIGRFKRGFLHRYNQFLACETPKGDCALASYSKPTYANPSERNFGRCATSNALWFRTEKERIARIYAPNEYRRGSSLSHFDESTYSTTNSLLTPFSAPGYAKHELDPLLFRILDAMLNQSELGAPLCDANTAPYVHPLVLSPLPSPSPSPSPSTTSAGMIIIDIRP